MNKNLKNPRKSAPEWKGFLNYNLTETDKANIRKMVDESPPLIDTFAQWLEAGFSLSIKWDSYSDCPMVVLKGEAQAGEDAGYAVSMRHSDLMTAVCGLIYMRHTFLDDSGQWLKDSDVSNEWDW